MSPVTGTLLVLLAGVFWSSIGVGVRSIEFANVWQILFFRSLAMTLFLFFVICYQSHFKPFITIARTGISGIIGGFGLVMAFSGGIYSIQTTTVANAMFLFASAPFITAVLGLLLLGEAVRRATWVAMAFAFMGIVIMVAQGMSSGQLTGNLAALAAALGFSVFTIALRWKKLSDMLPTIFIAGVFAIIISALVTWVKGYGLDVPAHDIIISLAMGLFQVGLGLVLYVSGSKVVPAVELALLSMTEVLLGPLWVWLFLGEVPSIYTLTGGIVLLCAIAGNALSGIRHKTTPVM